MSYSVVIHWVISSYLYKQYIQICYCIMRMIIIWKQHWLCSIVPFRSSVKHSLAHSFYGDMINMYTLMCVHTMYHIYLCKILTFKTNFYGLKSGVYFYMSNISEGLKVILDLGPQILKQRPKQEPVISYPKFAKKTNHQNNIVCSITSGNSRLFFGFIRQH